MQKTLDYYMTLPYTIELQYDPEDAWFVRVKELPGCMSQGDTPEEAVEMIQEAKHLWLEVALEDGDPIPEPRDLDDYSGKFVVRVPRSLHRDLVEHAAEEGISLNQYINVALAKAVAQPSRAGPTAGVRPYGAAQGILSFQQHVAGEQATRAGRFLQEKVGVYAGDADRTSGSQAAEPAQEAE